MMFEETLAPGTTSLCHVFARRFSQSTVPCRRRVGSSNFCTLALRHLQHFLRPAQVHRLPVLYGGIPDTAMTEKSNGSRFRC
jgi:hypothetical protein